MKPPIAAAALALVLVAAAAEAQTSGEPGAGMFGGEHGRGGVLRKACMTDIEQLCGSVEPGGGRIVQCLREHQDRVSNGCKEAMSSMRGGRHGDHAPSPSNPPAPAPN